MCPALGIVTLAIVLSGPDHDATTPRAVGCDGTAAWEQLPNGLTLPAAQDDVCYPFLAEGADQFVGTGAVLTNVGWWGAYFGGDPVSPDGFRIDIYTQSDDACPEALVYSEFSTAYNEDLGADLNTYCTALKGFTHTSGTPYFLSVTSVLCFPPQWGWATGDGDGTQACWRSPFFGYDDWAPMSDTHGAPYEFAFYLLDEELGTPTTEHTWTTLKALYQRKD
jgi:hypothetical protein